MTPDKNGRFCDECKITVVDFTVMTDLEIQHYFKIPISKTTCGRFNPQQLTMKKSDLLSEKLLSKIRASFYPNYLSAVLWFGFTILAFLTSCIKPNYPPIVGDVIGEPGFIKQNDTLKIVPNQLMGKVRRKE